MISTSVKCRGCYVAIVYAIMLMATEVQISVAMSRVDVPDLAPSFTLNDQHQTAHHYHFPRLKMSVLIFADYAASTQLEDWIRPLYDRYRETIAIDGVAVLSKAPKLIRGMVRSAFRDRLARPVMLDWSGAVSSDYQYGKGEANLFVIAPNGRILLKVVGTVSAAKLQRVRHAIDHQLNVD